MNRSPRSTVAVIGGSGLAELLAGERTTEHRVATPWGAPSGAIQEGRVGDLRVLFLPRHGAGHTIPPHRVNYRANVDALKSLGADAIVTVSSVGSLREEIPPGDFALPTQFLDFTKGRATTFFEGGKVYHVSMADPFCPDLLKHTAVAAAEAGTQFHPAKTYVCVEGPRFSTRAESAYFRTLGDIIGMTLVPEVTLARERGLCYACLAMVTDYDVWANRPVEAHDILDVMHRNADRMRRVLDRLLPRLATPPECDCARALEHAGV